MSTVRKFTFDRDFGAPEEPEVPEVEEEEEPEIIIPTFSEEEMAAARAEGVVEGIEQGRKEAADATEQKLLESIEQACEKIGEIYSAQAEANQEIGQEMISVSTAIAKKMFPDLNARNALGEVERVVQETLKAITEEPRVQIIVNPDLRELLNERLATMTHRAGFDGKVFVNGDPALILGDCRIEWSNGAAIRDSDELWEMIDEIIQRNLHGTPEDDDEENDEDDDVAEATPSSPDTPESDENIEPATESESEAEPESVPEPENLTESEAEAPADHTSEPESMQPDTDAFDDTPTEMPQDAQSSEINDETGEQASDFEDPPFAPSIPMADTLPEIDNSVADQPVTDERTEAPVPHIDDEPAPINTEDATNDEADGAEEPVRDFDPVSPATTAAILEAQSNMNDDDEPNPTDG